MRWPDAQAIPLVPPPPPTNCQTSTHTRTHTNTHIFSQTEQEQAIMARWPINHSSTGIIHKLLNQIPSEDSLSSCRAQDRLSPRTWILTCMILIALFQAKGIYSKQSSIVLDTGHSGERSHLKMMFSPVHSSLYENRTWTLQKEISNLQNLS